MSYDNNGQICQHNVTDIDPDTAEKYCTECGDVVDEPDLDADQPVMLDRETGEPYVINPGGHKVYL